MNIKTKIFLTSLISTTILTIGGGIVLYHFSAHNIKQAVETNLKTASVRKANWIRFYLKEQERNMSVLASTEDSRMAFKKIMDYYYKDRFYDLDKSKYKAIYKEMDPFFRSYLNVYNYHDIFFIGAAYGHVMYTARRETPLGTNLGAGKFKDSGLAHIWKKVVKERKVTYVDFKYYAPSKQPAMFIGAPAFNEKGEVYAVVVLQISIKEINEVMKDMTGLGNTGDTYLVGRDKLMRSDSRFSKTSTVLKQRVDTQNISMFLEKQNKSISSVAIYENYRGKSVIGMNVFIPELEWVLVAEISEEEAFASLNDLLAIFIAVGLVLIAILYLTSNWIGKKLSKPIVELEKGAEIITAGNLHHRVGINVNDEIGKLSYAFDNMTAKLQESYENLEEKVRMRTRDLEKANKELDSFAHTVSHDLRAPLRGISCFASFLEDDYGDKLDDEGKDNLSEIKKGADRLNDLIDDLLELSRISRIKNPYEEVDMNQLVDSVIERIVFEIKDKNVDLVVQDNLPILMCDRIKMAEAFLNLITNAIKFSSKNPDKQPHVEIQYEEQEEKYLFSVKDNGIGIDPKYKEDVFVLFKRLNRAGEFAGTGAGLNIVKSVIDDHDGEIWVESEIGEGAKFCFTIPKSLKNFVEQATVGEINNG